MANKTYANRELLANGVEGKQLSIYFSLGLTYLSAVAPYFKKKLFYQQRPPAEGILYFCLLNAPNLTHLPTPHPSLLHPHFPAFAINQVYSLPDKSKIYSTIIDDIFYDDAGIYIFTGKRNSKRITT